MCYNVFVNSARSLRALRTMIARPAVLLTHFANRNCPLWSYRYTGTLPRLISFVSHSYENIGDGGDSSQSVPPETVTVPKIPFDSFPNYLLSFQTLAHSLALLCTLL